MIDFKNLYYTSYCDKLLILFLYFSYDFLIIFKLTESSDPMKLIKLSYLGVLDYCGTSQGGCLSIIYLL